MCTHYMYRVREREGGRSYRENYLGRITLGDSPCTSALLRIRGWSRKQNGAQRVDGNGEVIYRHETMEDYRWHTWILNFCDLATPLIITSAIAEIITNRVVRCDNLIIYAFTFVSRNVALS